MECNVIFFLKIWIKSSRSLSRNKARPKVMVERRHGWDFGGKQLVPNSAEQPTYKLRAADLQPVGECCICLDPNHIVQEEEANL